jgi:hypothetical protein
LQNIAALKNSPIPGAVSDRLESSEIMCDRRPRQRAADLGDALHLQGQDAEPDMRFARKRARQSVRPPSERRRIRRQSV